MSTNNTDDGKTILQCAAARPCGNFHPQEEEGFAIDYQQESFA